MIIIILIVIIMIIIMIIIMVIKIMIIIMVIMIMIILMIIMIMIVIIIIKILIKTIIITIMILKTSENDKIDNGYDDDDNKSVKVDGIEWQNFLLYSIISVSKFENA